MADANWYLVHSKPQQEERARDHLLRQEYEAFLPRARVQVRRSGRFVRRIAPMFPRYLFVRLDTEHDDWSRIRSTFGVSTLVRFGNRPAVVPADLVASLYEAADAHGIVESLEPPDLEPGARVRIVDGPLQGYQGIVTASSGRERVHILLDLVNQHVHAQLSTHQVVQVRA